MSVLEYAVLGIIQGVAEWLPVSSEGLVVLVRALMFGGAGLADLVRVAVFLHLGTLMAAVAYFRKDVRKILGTLVRYGSSGGEEKALFNFLVVSTVVSGGFGYLLLMGMLGAEAYMGLTGMLLTVGIGLLLIATGIIQIQANPSRAGDPGLRGSGDSGLVDGIVAGVLQGLAILPGLSRSGLTVGGLLLRRFDRDEAIRMSFLMSIPAVILGNIALNWGGFGYSLEGIVGLVVAFLFGIITIHLFLKMSRKVNFGLFVLAFGVLTVVAGILLT